MCCRNQPLEALHHDWCECNRTIVVEAVDGSGFFWQRCDGGARSTRLTSRSCTVRMWLSGVAEAALCVSVAFTSKWAKGCCWRSVVDGDRKNVPVCPHEAILQL